MLALSIALTWRALLRPRRRGDTPVDVAGGARALLTWAVFAGTAVAMQWIGFVLGFALLSAFIVAHVFEHGWRRAAPVGIACAAGFWVVFHQLLGVSPRRGCQASPMCRRCASPGSQSPMSCRRAA